MYTRLSALILTVLSPCLACASAPVDRDVPCELVAPDSPFLLGGPVYPECAVDEPARPRGRTIYPENFDPRIPLTGPTAKCYVAELLFVVDTSGTPELLTAQVPSTNHPEFGEAVLATLPRWRYRPARKGGVAVRQIVQVKRELELQVVVVREGDVPLRRRPPPC